MKTNTQVLLTSLALFNGTHALAQHTPAEAEQTQPNIILFLVDDMGWQDTSVPFHTEVMETNERFNTPHMEALAAMGMVFTNAYAASPVCSPTRTSIMTGQHPARTRVTDWLGHMGPDNQPAVHNNGRDHFHQLPDWNRVGLTSESTTLPRLLQEAGYRTIHVGKAHLGTAEGGQEPLNLGFDQNIAGNQRGGPGSYYGQDNYAARNGGWQVPHLEAYHGTDTYLNDALTIEANRLIEEAVNADEPFFLHMSHYAIHAPIQGDHRRRPAYENAGLTESQIAYATMVESMDASLGSIMAQLEQLEIDDNTIIVFFSDNGPLVAHSGPPTTAAPLRGGKGTAYEGGYRVPMIVHWPDMIEAGSRSHDVVNSCDLMPTLLEMAGASHLIPQDFAQDGESLTPLLTQTGELQRGQEVLIHYPHYWWRYGGANGSTPGIEPFTAIREGDWKLLYFYHDQRYELYNLQQDIGEQNNLINDNTCIAHRQRLTALLQQRMTEMNAQGMADRQTGEPIQP